jgi:hypothetical protein
MSGGRGGGALVVAGVVIFALAHAHGVHLPAAASTTAVVSHGGTLGCSGLERLWEQAGGSPSAAFTAAEVAIAESGGQQDPPSNAGSNYNGKTDVGYWQINSGIWPSLATTDPIGNAKAAVQISHDGQDWSPWVTYQTGAYQGQC